VVYRGGLENRFPVNRGRGFESLPLRQCIVNYLTKLLIWAAAIGLLFAFMWWKGYLLQISNYVQQTREELRKCTWPTWEELKGSTVVVTISIALLSGFIVLVDFIFVHVNVWILKL
jgi:preprotein translocase subunit SecE